MAMIWCKWKGGLDCSVGFDWFHYLGACVKTSVCAPLVLHRICVCFGQLCCIVRAFWHAWANMLMLSCLGQVFLLTLAC